MGVSLELRTAFNVTSNFPYWWVLCEHSNEPVGSLKGVEFLKQLYDCQFLKDLLSSTYILLVIWWKDMPNATSLGNVTITGTIGLYELVRKGMFFFFSFSALAAKVGKMVLLASPISPSIRTYNPKKQYMNFHKIWYLRVVLTSVHIRILVKIEQK
jgi:hypothetical protein